MQSENIVALWRKRRTLFTTVCTAQASMLNTIDFTLFYIIIETDATFCKLHTCESGVEGNLNSFG